MSALIVQMVGMILMVQCSIARGIPLEIIVFTMATNTKTLARLQTKHVAFVEVEHTLPTLQVPPLALHHQHLPKLVPTLP